MLYKILVKGTLMLGYHNAFELRGSYKRIQFYTNYPIRELEEKGIDLYAKMDWDQCNPYVVRDVFLLTFWKKPDRFTSKLVGAFPVVERDWAQGIKEFALTKQGILKSAIGKEYRPNIQGCPDRGTYQRYSHGRTYKDEKGVGFFLRSWDPFFIRESPRNVCSVVSFPITTLDYIEECGSHAVKVIRI